MPVNLNQYCGTVRVFNNHNLPTRKTFCGTVRVFNNHNLLTNKTYVFSGRLLQQPLSKTYSTKILVSLLIIAIRFVICSITAQNVRLDHRSLFKGVYFVTIALYIHHV